jgi:hypothetical protein
MAAVENLKAVRGVDDKVTVVHDQVTVVNDKVTVVDDRVIAVHNKVTAVDDSVAGVSRKMTIMQDSVKCFDDKMKDMGDHIIQGTENLSANRPHRPEYWVLIGVAEKLRQQIADNPEMLNSSWSLVTTPQV